MSNEILNVFEELESAVITIRKSDDGEKPIMIRMETPSIGEDSHQTEMKVNQGNLSLAGLLTFLCIKHKEYLKTRDDGKAD